MGGQVLLPPAAPSKLGAAQARRGDVSGREAEEAQTGLALRQRFGPSRAPHAPGARGALSFRRLG